MTLRVWDPFWRCTIFSILPTYEWVQRARRCEYMLCTTPQHHLLLDPAPHIGCGALCWPHQHRVAHCTVEQIMSYRVENRPGANARQPDGRPSAPHPLRHQCSPAYVVLSTFLWKTGTLGIRMSGVHCCEKALCNARGSASVLATVVAMLRRPMQWGISGDAGGAAQCVQAQRDWSSNNA